ncbi:hypothetical protein BKA00_006013 [Actinomadura coerulea]|uniref:DUF4352 domain-containing protein n=1 Tax=Actinomadura coerulea TaxID=46159 RepID=A0A7X0G446_9ACTN|nr:hypothetical protein [Actinomadura coerulea]MBB6399099.1 hypothetical protein [Actinomadura coerulea]GGQ23389.1 hypothetical protein GCM10010187_44780 [Actinomadura coerulea]
MRALPLAVSSVGLLLVAGCADAGRAEKVAPPTVRAGAALPTVQPAGAYAKEGWFGGADGLHARVAIRGVERQAAKSVLRYSVTSLDSSVKSVPFEIALLDTAGRRLYKPTGTTSGSGFAPGTTREMAADYPPIPATVQKVTAITPGTAGEFTGIPVSVASAGPSATPSLSSAPPSGSVPSSSTPPSSPSASSSPSVGAEPEVGAQPFMAGAPSPITTSPTPTASGSPSTTAPGGNPVDLYDIVEEENRTVVSNGSSATVSLRSDTLFEIGSAKLKSGAKAVLDGVSQQIKGQASGALTFVANASDTKVSGDRAQALLNEMKTRLGAGFTYTANGRQDGDGVDFTYQLKSAPQVSTPPAAFRAQDGQNVVTRTAPFGAAKRRLEVKPFYRDGAYIVAVFDIVNEGPGTTPPDASYPNASYPGGVFGSFSIQVPGKKDVYRAVRVGPPTPGRPTDYIDPGRAVFRTAVNEPVRGFVYLPAPPGKVTSVTFNAGPFGKVDKAPVS